MLLKLFFAVTSLGYAFQTITLTRENVPTKSNYIYAKYNRMLGGSADVDLQSWMNVIYYGNVQLGTPAVSYLVWFSTGYSNLWVPAIDCTNCGIHTKYNPSASSTYQANGSSLDIPMSGESIKGYVAHDVLTIGDLQCELDFAAVTHGPKVMLLAKFDGIFGLGWPNATVDGLSPLMQRLNDEGVIDSYMFGFYIPSDVKKTGKLTIGGYDKSKAKTINWVPTANDNLWSVNIQKLSFGGRVATTANLAIIDSSIAAVMGPKDEVAAAAKHMGAKYINKKYTVGCNVYIPDMEVTLGRDTLTNLTIKGDHLRIKVCTFIIFCKCYLAMAGVDSPNSAWVFGNVLMRDYYTIFDFENAQIGFSAHSTSDDEEFERSYKAAAY